MKIISELLIAAVYSAFFQNIIFSGGYGVSEAVRSPIKPRQTGTISFFVALFTLLCGVSCRALDMIPTINDLGTAMHLLIFTAVEFLIYLIVVLIFAKLVKASKKFVSLIGIAAFNTLIMAVPLLNRRAGSDLAECVGMALGAGVSFALASALIGLGIKTIRKNKSIPESFRYTPAVFIYVGLLSLAFMGFSGQSLFV